MNNRSPDPANWRRFTVRYGATAIVVALAAYVLIESFDVSAAIQAVTEADPALTIGAFVSFYISFPLRTRRWRQFLDSIGTTTDWKSANLILLTGFYLNVLVPAKLGDFYRAILASREYDAPASTIGGTIASERILDLALLAIGVLVLLPVVLSTNLDSSQRILFGSALLLAVLLCAVVLLSIIPSAPLPTRVKNILKEFRTGLRGSLGRSPRDLTEIVVLSLSIWASNIVRTWFVTQALGVHLSMLEIALLAVLVALLSGLPYVQSGIGVVEVIGSTILITIGLTPEAALAVIFLDRFITLVTLVVFGTPMYAYTVHLRND